MKYLFSLILSIYSISIFAQEIIEPCKFGQPLIEYIQDEYTPSNPLGYGPARDILYSEIDNVGLNLSAVYTDFTITLNPALDPSVNAFDQGINAEHVYPQSQGAGDEPAKSDLHNIFPSKVNVNSDRGSCPYGEIEDSDTEKWYYLSSQLNSIPTTDIDKYSEKDEESCVFEPREEVKGDIARAMFYFFAIYQQKALSASSTYFANQKEILYQWHLDDPVDAVESTRNELIAMNQGNDNPFIIDSTLAWRAFFEADASYPVGDPNCFTTSLEDLVNDANVQIASNSIENELVIFCKKNNGKALLFSVDGKLMLETDLGMETRINSSFLQQGVYILNVLVEGQRRTFKVLKK